METANAAGVQARPLHRSSLMTQGALAFVGSMALNLGGFGFHAVAAHRLGVHAYGVLYAVVSIAVLAALPSTLVSPSLARLTAELLSRDANHAKRLARDVIGVVVLLSGIYACLFFALAPLAAAAFRLPLWSLGIAGGIAASMAASALFRALVQGERRFGAYALSTASEGFVKFAGIVLLSAAGLGLVAGAAGFLAGVACGAIIAIVSVRPSAREGLDAVPYDVRRIVASGAGAAAMTIALTLMGSADVVIVKHFFPAQAAGLYAAASLMGKIVLYVVGFIPLVLLPVATTSHTSGDRNARTLFTALVAFAAIAGTTLLVISVGRFQLIHVLVGRAFDPAAGLLCWYALAMAFLALGNIVATYGIATHRIAFSAPLVLGTLATLGVIAVAHATLLEVVRVMAFGNAATAALVIGAVALQSLRDAPARA